MKKIQVKKNMMNMMNKKKVDNINKNDKNS